MWARAAAERGFTTIELLLAVFVCSVGVIALVGTLDMSRRLTSYSEMKETASHRAQQTMEELRAIEYDNLALAGNPSPSTSTDPNEPPYHLGSDATGGKTFRWDHKAGSAAAAEPLVIDAAKGRVPATAQPWSDGRIKGNVYRYVTCAATTAAACDAGPTTSAYKRITVAVTVDNAFGPQSPIIVSTLVGNPDVANGIGSNPLDSPDTKCKENDVLVDCVRSVEGTVRTWYLYDTPATFTERQEISGSHSTHATVAPSGTCTGTNTSGCPVPDLMGLSPPPAPTVTPPVYNYSSEITGGTTPGGTVVRRDTSCTGTPTTTDNTKGHMWVTSPLEAPMTLSGDAALSLSTQTFNGVSAGATVCVRFYSVPGDISNLVATPPTALGGTAKHQSSAWPTSAASANLNFTVDFVGGGSDPTIPAGNRLGVRIWVEATAGADLVLLYDHPLHGTFVQVNES